MTIDSMMKHLNEIDTHLDTITRLCELGPLLEDGGPQYFRHAITLLALVGECTGEIARYEANLVAQVRAEEGRP
jgi:hypothetical protein